jgi:hypothetical protein
MDRKREAAKSRSIPPPASSQLFVSGMSLIAPPETEGSMRMKAKPGLAPAAGRTVTGKCGAARKKPASLLVTLKLCVAVENAVAPALP